MLEYYVLNLDPQAPSVWAFIRLHSLTHELHLNRTRFKIDPHSPAYTEFVLRYLDHCSPVDLV
jgi:hypothetical protein